MLASANFERLVLVCIDASDSESRRIFQHFLRSTRSAFFCTALNSFAKKMPKLLVNVQMFFFLQIFARDASTKSERRRCRGAVLSSKKEEKKKKRSRKNGKKKYENRKMKTLV